MNYLHIDKVFSLITNGCTEPLDALLSTGERAIIKPYNNIQGNLVLLNEYICNKLCIELDIPSPEGGIAVIDEYTQCMSKIDEFSEDNYGFCYFSKRIDKATVLNASIIGRITNKEDFYKIILFDHFVYNKDRNLGNMLVTTGRPIKMFAIDHTHVFKNECIWDKNCFKRGIADCDYNDDRIIESNREIYDYFWQHLGKDKNVLKKIAYEFKENITKEKLEKYINELPKEWMPSSEDVIALKDYILYRFNHHEEICDLIIGVD